MLGTFVRKRVCKALTGEKEISLVARTPSREELRRRFEGIDELGVYLHVPFCRQVCSYCPYNKELYDQDVARRYAVAVKAEIDAYADIVGDRPVTSLYIGGGTPTTMLDTGLAETIEHLRSRLRLRCDIHMESHPNDLSDESLRAIRSLGVRHLSTGVESLRDRDLRFLGRPYSAATARDAVERAVGAGFDCVNVDIIFALPRQTCRELRETAEALVELGVDQVATYPLFRFPYTALGSGGRPMRGGARAVLRRRRLLRALERVFYGAGFERTSVWGFTRAGIPRYCSVTVPLYLGLGASGGSYLRDAFFLNTFRVADYIRSIEERGSAIALTLDLTTRMQMAGWLYWRIYETRFAKGEFRERFDREFDEVYGRYMRPLRLLGFLEGHGEQVVLSDRGSYWLHAFEDVFSIEYISRLWGTSRQIAWPERVAL